MSDSDKESKKQTDKIRKRVLKGSLVVSAGAGTGKTFNLIQAYLSAVEQLKEEKIDRVFDKILAITFTNAATYEFKHRVQGEVLKDRADMEPFLTSQEISTIHSACQRILSNLALGLGLNPATEIFEEDQDTNYALELINEIVGDAVALGDKGVLDLLSRYDYNGFEFRAGLKDILLGFHSKTRSRGWSIQDTVKNCKAAVSSLNSSLTSPKADFERWLASSGIIRNPAQVQLASQLLREVVTVSNEFLDLYAKFAIRFEREKQLSGNISHDDSLYYVNMALEASPDRDLVKAHLKSRHKVVLVDEYQDTDPIQDCIIEDISPKNGVFRVGDVKQSIFRFRRAEPAIFQGRVSAAEKKGDELESLVYNRRSRHALVAFTNRIFKRIFNDDFLPRNGLGGVKFEELKPARERTTDERELDRWDPVEVFRITWQPGDPRDSMYGDEATFIAKRIQELVGNFPVYSKKGKTVTFEKCRYKDIAILLRSKGHLQTYLQELRNNNIPFIVRDNPGFFDQYEVNLVVTFLRYLNQPNDRFLQSVLLRSAVFGVTDRTLFRLAQNKGVIDEGLLSSLADTKETETLKRFKSVNDEFQAKRSLSKQRLLQEVIKVTDLDLLSYSTVTGSQAYANLLKLVDMGGNFDRELNGSLDSFIDWLDNLNETTKQDQAGAYDEDSNAVKVMTIHASKGLEFPVVFIPQIFRDFWNPGEDYFVSDNAKLKLADGTQPELPFLLKPGDSGRSGLGANQANLIVKNIFDRFTSSDDEEFTNEEWRLLYVAFTRARDLLLFSICPGYAQWKLKRFSDWKLAGAALTSRIASEDWNIKLLQIMPGLADKGEVTLATK